MITPTEIATGAGAVGVILGALVKQFGTSAIKWVFGRNGNGKTEHDPSTYLTEGRHRELCTLQLSTVHTKIDVIKERLEKGDDVFERFREELKALDKSITTLVAKRGR